MKLNLLFFTKINKLLLMPEHKQITWQQINQMQDNCKWLNLKPLELNFIDRDRLDHLSEFEQTRMFNMLNKGEFK